MKKVLEDVEKFHKAFGHPVASEPTIVDKDLSNLRFNLLFEELEEYLQACHNKDIIEIADALGDILYILAGTVLVHGLQDKMQAIFDEIQRSNMSKLGEDGEPIYREDGKILKGPGYSKPDIKSILND